MADRNHLERFTKELIDQGKLIEAGWVGMRLACGLEDAPADQLHQMRMAFFAGAQHLMGSISCLIFVGVDNLAGNELECVEPLRQFKELTGAETDDLIAKITELLGE